MDLFQTHLSHFPDKTILRRPEAQIRCSQPVWSWVTMKEKGNIGSLGRDRWQQRGELVEPSTNTE